MSKLIAWLQLCRLAAVFTAMADVFLGYLLTHDEGIVDWGEFGLLLGSSSCLYLAGMVFNDVFDRQVDLLERPKRPIPSGRVPLRGAIALGTVFVVVGVALSAFVGRTSLIVAGVLTLAIFLYDGLLKSTIVGPLVMGLCRFFNVLLGASALPLGELTTHALWSMPQVGVAAGLGVYIVGVTWFARNEAGESGRWQLFGALLTVNFGLVALIALVIHWRDPYGRSWNAALALASVGLIINRRLLQAISDPVPKKVQLAVRIMLLSLVMLDASLIFFFQADKIFAVFVVCLLIPATFLGKRLAIT